MPVLDVAAMNSGTGKEFEDAPEENYQGVVVDFEDLGWRQKKFKGESKGFHPYGRYVYQVFGFRETGEEKDGEPVLEPILRSDGTPFIVWDRPVPISFNENSAFYKQTAAILGGKVLAELIASGQYDTDVPIGANVDMDVTHSPRENGGVFTNVENVKPWRKMRGPFKEAEGFERKHERENYAPPIPSAYLSRKDAMAILERHAAGLDGSSMQRPQNAAMQRDTRFDAATKQQEQAAMHQRVRNNETNLQPQPVAAYPGDEDDDPFADA
jgi:hypothetical protein